MGSNGGFLKERRDDIEKAIQWIAKFETQLGKAGKVAKFLANQISKVRKFLRNITYLIDSLDYGAMTPLSVLTVVFYLFASTAIAALAVGTVGIVANSICGGYCGLLAGILVTPLVLDGINAVLDDLVIELREDCRAN